MSLKKYLSEHSISLIIYCIISGFMGILLYVQNFTTYGIVFVESGFILGLIIFIASDYIKRAVFYKNVVKSYEELDRRCLLSEIIERPNFYEGQILYDVLSGCNKSMNDEIAKYKISSKEYKEYIEMWIHEVKTPVSSIKLIMENSLSDISEQSLEEVSKIDDYLEQVLYYARSSSLEKDYIIKKIPLINIIRSSLKSHAKEYIRSKVSIKLDDLDTYVYTDEKWMGFVIIQILNNAVKYKDKNKESFIKIYCEENKNNVVLSIEDNGIGIDEKDILKVFDKGFTGSTGRIYAKSTGIGLYLSKKLCLKMGHNIQIESIKGVGTKVHIIFPKSEYINVTKV